MSDFFDCTRWSLTCKVAGENKIYTLFLNRNWLFSPDKEVQLLKTLPHKVLKCWMEDCLTHFISPQFVYLTRKWVVIVIHLPHDTSLHQPHLPSISPPSLPWPIPSHLHHFHVIIIHQGGVWHFLHQLNISEALSIIKQEHSEVFLSRHQLSRLYPTRALANSVVCVRTLTCLLSWLTFQPINDGGSEVEAGEQAVSQRGAKQLVEPITPISY